MGGYDVGVKIQGLRGEIRKFIDSDESSKYWRDSPDLKNEITRLNSTMKKISKRLIHASLWIED
ncbi:MAG: hypothetical protein K9N46_02220 [Candidatus Marinimicrobia bacterium]|nr:hypothetical protein [Candidatus Neomarinimicrobiota bacterium]MCF7828286.1 hypothetical protein [Candidatus Neomarinimicrobiota bacterium]MCF7879539.1 hypothetical protein [Candidatus Neomarinimicrobiota bacterium]